MSQLYTRAKPQSTFMQRVWPKLEKM